MSSRIDTSKGRLIQAYNGAKNINYAVMYYLISIKVDTGHPDHLQRNRFCYQYGHSHRIVRIVF